MTDSSTRYVIIRTSATGSSTLDSIKVKLHVACMEEGRGVQRVLVGRPEGKRPLERPRHRWKDNIKMDLTEIGIDGANWIRLA
jgi:hypothetical protein